ncbi:WXG100 family type VII secretion target [Streptomyces sp. P9(2023)]|uniref:WXG100 family type VII secretion target n=1 Tax=Streptomyces sp. P9(2023) TaxID=3064394 RepID=UPI0028F4588C|nr:WXG100 family type VII secretion target [Streptomyces sp. P9(2023)]MDT9690562.1 WXG100 family type VII secretion target [Streptomyces sp. P9(2023)]
MTTRGADIERLRDLAKLFGTKAGDLQSLITALNTATSSSTGYWKGPKSNQFRTDWENARGTFSKWVDTLNDAQKSASTSADNIERAT